jgi:hypothetical protein
MSVQLFYSKPARMMIYLAIPVILVTQFTEFNSTSIFIQALTYAGIAYNAECLVEGGCDIWAWVSVLLPIVYSLLFIFFGNQLNLVPLPPSPLTNIIPVKKSRSTQEQPQLLSEPDTTIIYTDNIDNVLAANSEATSTDDVKENMNGDPSNTKGLSNNFALF